MLRNLNKNSETNIAKVTFVMTIITIFVKLLGFSRDIVLANCYGASNISDAFLIAFSIPSVLFSVIGKAISTSLIPIYAEEEKIERKKGECFISKLCLYCLVLSCLLIGIIAIFPNFIIKIFASSFDIETAKICKDILLVGMFSLLFMVLSGIFTAYVQVKKHYIISTLISLPLNIILIVSIVLSLKTSYIVLGFGIILAYASEFFLLLPIIIKEKFSFKPSLKFDKPLKRALIMILPMLAGSCASQINHMADKSVASKFGEGGISILSYASTISVAIQELFITGLLSLIFVEFTYYLVDGKMDLVKRKAADIISAVIKVLLPIMLLCIFFSDDISEIIFIFKGDVSSSLMSELSKCLQFYSLGIIFVAIRDIYVKMFYSLKNTLVPTISTVISVILNVLLNYLLYSLLGLYGIALATSISSFVSMIILFVVFKLKYFTLEISKEIEKILIVAVFSFASILFSKTLFNLFNLNLIIKMILEFAVSCGVTFGSLLILKVNILDFLKKGNR